MSRISYGPPGTLDIDTVRAIAKNAKEKKAAAAKAAAAATAEANKITFDAKIGRFHMGDQTLTLSELMFTITGKAANVAKEMLAVTAQKLADANADGEAALEWRNTMAAHEPEGASGTSDNMQQLVRDFEAKHGFNPVDTYGLRTYASDTDTFNKADFDKMYKAMDSYTSTVSNNQSKLNLDTERGTHIVTEARELGASVLKSLSDLLSAQANKI